MHPARCALKAAPLDFSPYSARTTMAFLPAIITELFPKSGPDFLLARCGDVGIQHIHIPSVSGIQHCREQGYSHDLSGHDAGIREGCRSLCCMSHGYEQGLWTKILHLKVDDPVKAYKLMIRRWGHTIHRDVESNTHILLSFSMASCQNVMPVALSMAYASLTVLGISILYL
jgi:hypothetical protein